MEIGRSDGQSNGQTNRNWINPLPFASWPWGNPQMVVFWGTCDAWRVCIHMSTFTILNWIMALMMMQARHLVVEKHANKLIGLAESAHPFRQITCTEPDASPPLCHPSSPPPPPFLITHRHHCHPLVTPFQHQLNSIHLCKNRRFCRFEKKALPMDRQTDGRTDGQTDPLIEMRGRN